MFPDEKRGRCTLEKLRLEQGLPPLPEPDDPVVGRLDGWLEEMLSPLPAKKIRCIRDKYKKKKNVLDQP
ncbi:hypothetical protein [Desulfobotulus mexicanus]|uniref:Uncharacterized protein n=1 Tax=Desulfobotulus mexicanus TaxID=2586642 RepID=A0A5S5MFF9_9BACT|nr:hypothetical protein [Desulfobotulus mexicanus]TYT74430.1 hypothetical protein FIM25_09730 [Desulfobotulus mexicanus]